MSQLLPEYHEAGISPQMLQSTRRFTCPRCGREFSLYQSRGIACRSCPQVNRNCRFVRCIYCDAEFPMEGFNARSKIEAQRISDFMGGVMDSYYRSFGFRKA